MKYRNILFLVFFFGATQANSGKVDFCDCYADLHDIKRPKVFKNNTDKPIVLEWGVHAPEGAFYKQQPLIRPGQSCVVDFARGFSSVDAEKDCKITLSVGQVKTIPQKPASKLSFSRLHKDMKLRKWTLKNNDEFEFYQAKNKKMYVHVYKPYKPKKPTLKAVVRS